MHFSFRLALPFLENTVKFYAPLSDRQIDFCIMYTLKIINFHLRLVCRIFKSPTFCDAGTTIIVLVIYGYHSDAKFTDLYSFMQTLFIPYVSASPPIAPHSILVGWLLIFDTDRCRDAIWTFHDSIYLISPDSLAFSVMR